MYRHLLVLAAAGPLQASCILCAQALALRGDADSPVTFARRASATGDVHESFFIPTVIASGVVFFLAILCLLMILLTSSAPRRPSLPQPQTHQIDHDQPILPGPSPRPRSAFLSRGNTASNTSASGSFYYNEPASTRIQRKPAPVFQPSPPGTASGSSRGPGPNLPPSAYVHPLRPGVPQHPSLAKYNPEPLVYEPKSPVPDVGEPSSSQGPQKMMAYQWTHPQAPYSQPQAQPQPQPGPSMPMPILSPIPASSSSITRVGSGSGASDQLQQDHHHHPQPLTADHPSKPSLHPSPPARNPPSPPPTPPHAQIQTHQKTDQRQSYLTTTTAPAPATRHEALPTIGSLDHRDAYGGIETDEEGVRVHHHHHHHSRASSSQHAPPGYAESVPLNHHNQREYPPEKVVLRPS